MMTWTISILACPQLQVQPLAFDEHSFLIIFFKFNKVANKVRGEALVNALASSLLVSWKVHPYRSTGQNCLLQSGMYEGIFKPHIKKTWKKSIPSLPRLGVPEEGVAFQVHLLPLKNILLLKAEGTEACKEKLW